MSFIQERYNPIPMAANTTLKTNSSGLGGFLCVTAGNIQISKAVTPEGAGGVMLATMAVLAGVYYPLVMNASPFGSVVALSGGASGTLLVD